jgi:hypothetical protein
MPSDSNFDICDSIFLKIIDHYGKVILASDLPEVHQTVLLAWHAYGIIGNGGFEYLFDGSIDGDPNFRLTCKSFETINCEKAYEAFKEALAVFPDEETLLDQKKRKSFYGSCSKEVKNSINRKFWSVGMTGSKEIEFTLARYIGEHQPAFDELL